MAFPYQPGMSLTITSVDGSGNITGDDWGWSDALFLVNLAAAIAANLPTRSFSYITTPLNSATQISTTRDAFVAYSVEVGCSLSLSGGTTGTTILEIADDSAFTTNVKELCRSANGNTGSLTIGLNITQTFTARLNGMVPANKYRRVRTVNTTGTPTFTAQAGQEVLLY